MNQIISNKNIFPYLKPGSDFFMLDVSSSPDGITYVTGQPAVIQLPLFSPALLKGGYSDLYQQQGSVSAGGQNIGLVGTPLNSYPALFPVASPNYLFQDSSNVTIKRVQFDCMQQRYCDLLDFLLSDAIYVKNIRVTMKMFIPDNVEIDPGPPPVFANPDGLNIGMQRNAQIVFFTKSLSGVPKFDSVTIGALIDPVKNYQSGIRTTGVYTGTGTFNGLAGTFIDDIIDFPVDFFINKNSGISFPVSGCLVSFNLGFTCSSAYNASMKPTGNLL